MLIHDFYLVPNKELPLKILGLLALKEIGENKSI